MIRRPVVAGAFYPGTTAALKAELAKYIDLNATKEDVVGLLMPHAGYRFSGAVAGAAISRVTFKDTFIIIGPKHYAPGEPISVWPDGSWQTPLGSVQVDAELAAGITQRSRYAKADYRAHEEDEHAIEVQVPFLQYIKPHVRIVPILMGGIELAVCREIGHAIAEAVKDLKREAVILSSGDMTHYEQPERAEVKDMSAIEAMLALDEAELTRRYYDIHMTMCALGPVCTMLAAAKELGVKSAELVKYGNSGDATGDGRVVAYAGVIFKK
jgi:AmmeMemoRadiSam system protein B